MTRREAITALWCLPFTHVVPTRTDTQPPRATTTDDRVVYPSVIVGHWRPAGPQSVPILGTLTIGAISGTWTRDYGG